MIIDTSYKDQTGNIWVCKARGMTDAKERFAILVNKKGTVWFTTEPDWKLFKTLVKPITSKAKGSNNAKLSNDFNCELQ